ncbi:dihydroneopterin aldolase [Oleisolibacter albus]|uniref:dihydroneopterin aldolase n=1 Tax=Oleisolibacter albus TaxID=2171757 RepID=UPI000DF15F07|nr:dihydroneopterin aldolase [Oleisolibacter albus]
MPARLPDEHRLRLIAALGEARVIFLRNFALPTSIGIHAFEKAAPQRLLVNIELFLRPQRLERDEIDDVLDYDVLRRQIADLAGSRHWNLQETLLDRIAALCLDPPMVLGVRVSTEKPDVYPDCEAVGLEVSRFKPLE